MNGKQRRLLKEVRCMKSYPFFFGALILVICLSTTFQVDAQGPASVEVIEGVICKDVLDRVPVEMGIRFPASVGRLYCFTKLATQQVPTQVTHVWYYGDVERARITLPINSSTWRTFSSKKIQIYEVGQWLVDIVGPDGNVIQTLRFRITP
jgi:hypothetical protein